MNAPQYPELERKLITVASGKGGVGKTWLAVTLCHAMARAGQNVLLFDGDLGLANVDIQLGLMPEQDVSDAVTGDLDLDAAITRYEEEKGDGGFDVLAGRSGSGALGNLNKDRLRGIRAGITAMAGRYDHVILDLAAGIDPSVTTLSDHAGTILVVMTADPTSLTDAYAYIKVISMRKPNADLRIVVNNVTSKREGEKAYTALNKSCSAFLKLSPPLAGIVKADKRVGECIRHQSPLLTRHPQSEAGANVTELARKFGVKATA